MADVLADVDPREYLLGGGASAEDLDTTRGKVAG